MDYLQTIIVGIVQGLTEFLPVSSSGHIVLVSYIYKIITGSEFMVENSEEVFFDIMIHFGTLVAIFIYFRKKLINIFTEFFKAIKTKAFKNNYQAQLPIYIILGTFFTCIIVYPIKDFCESLLNTPYIVGILLIITGLILFLSEFLSKKFEQKQTEINTKNSILIGLAQGLAALPGISRSGSTIAMGLATGLNRKDAAEYSFLLSIPVILLAVFYHSLELLKAGEFADFSFGPIIVGTILAGVVGYFCIKYFIAFLNKFSLNIFGFYCVSVGIITTCIFLFFKLS